MSGKIDKDDMGPVPISGRLRDAVLTVSALRSALLHAEIDLLQGCTGCSKER